MAQVLPPTDPPPRLRETGYAESLVAFVARRNKLPTRTVWLPPNAGWRGSTVDPAENESPEELESWTEVGEFERVCRHCGELIHVVPFLGDDRQRVRYVRRLEGVDHPCPGTSIVQRRERAMPAFLAALDSPADAAVQRIAAAAHLPERFHPGLHRLVRTGDNGAALVAAHDMLQRFQEMDRSRGLYLWGGVGTGKSAITKALGFDLAYRTGELAPEGWSFPLVRWGTPARVQWWFVPRLFTEMAKRWDREPSEYDPQRIEQSDCLMLDDLGKEHPSGFKKSEIFRLLNDRYDRNRALVITSNYAPGDLAGRMIEAQGVGSEMEIEALFDRICEVCEVVELPGESWRRTRRAA